MSKLNLNYDNIRNSSVCTISLAIKKLDNAIALYNNLNIPYDYIKRANIINLKNDIIVKRNQLKEILNWIINSNNDYTKLINDLMLTSNKLPKNKFGQRQSF